MKNYLFDIELIKLTKPNGDVNWKLKITLGGLSFSGYLDSSDLARLLRDGHATAQNVAINPTALHKVDKAGWVDINEETLNVRVFDV